jgi:YegS/Rv2252/BmrU family lipid kinase
MKHLFIVNPAAGRKNQTDFVVKSVKTAFSGRDGEEFEIYVTKAPRDAESVIRARALSTDAGALRVYACGGDGTLNECVNGAAGLKNVSVTHFPCGTGNDFIKTFGGDRSLFFEMDRLIDGFTRPIDIISAAGRCSINICSVGIDARIGVNVHKYSGIPLIGGAFGYIVSTAAEFLKGVSRPMRVRCGAWGYSGEVALVCVCNGRFYGGGFKPVPDAMPDDGVLDVIIVPKISRLDFIRIIGDYARGRAYKHPDKIIRLREDSVSVTAKEDFIINFDGEAVYGAAAHFELIPGGLSFCFPRGLTFFKETQEEKAVTV